MTYKREFLKTIKHCTCSIENANVCSELLWRKKRALLLFEKQATLSTHLMQDARHS